MINSSRAAIRWFLTVAALFPALGSADCGNITRQLLGVETGGPRTYLTTNLPVGISLYSEKLEWLTGGADALTSKSSELRQLNLTAEIYWHENRVAWVTIIVQGGAGSDIASARQNVIAISGITEFLPPPANEYLRCGDGLMAKVGISQRSGPNNSVIPLLVVLIEHPKLKKELITSSQSGAENEKRLAAAAHAGDLRAQTILGKSHKERAKGTEWLRRAAKGGYAEAQHELALRLGLSDPESWLWF